MQPWPKAIWLFYGNKQKQIPEEFKDLAKDFAEKGFITTSSDNSSLALRLVQPHTNLTPKPKTVNKLSQIVEKL